MSQRFYTHYITSLRIKQLFGVSLSPFLSENIDCRFFFDGSFYDCKGQNKLGKKVVDALGYFLETKTIVTMLIRLWNNKNPNYKVM
jgi:hypothetical protein